MKHGFRRLLALLLAAALLPAALGAVAEAVDLEIEAVEAEEAAGEVETLEPAASEVSELPDIDAPLENGDSLANVGTLSVDTPKVLVPVNGCARITVTLPKKGDVETGVSVDGVVAVRWSTVEPVNGQYDVYLYGLKAGKATVTFSNEKDKRETASVRVTVKKQKGYKSLSVSTDSVTVRVGDTVNLSATLTLPEGFVDCSSANKRIATAKPGEGVENNDWPLYITGVKKGTTIVTVTNDQNKEKVTVKVTVKKAGKKVYSGQGKADGKQTCRALLVAQEDFKGVLESARGDLGLMREMLKSVTGPDGNAWKVTERTSLTTAGLTNAVYDTFKKADDDDLSLFFIATHGDEEANGSAAGALLMCPDGQEKLKLGKLAEMLKAVPGKVIIIIEACGSGAGVYKTPSEQNAALLSFQRSAQALDSAVVRAFSAADDGIATHESTRSAPRDGASANTGELRVKNKFYVLTSARYHEFSWAKKTSYFVKWLTDGVGKTGAMPADKDGNGILTLQELYKYISYVGDDVPTREPGHVYYQHVQIYPKGSAFKLFKRK